MSDPIVIAIDGPSASGKSTNAKIIAAALGYAYVDTGAMYRTLAWHALQQSVDVTNAAAVAALCTDWPAALVNREGSIWLEVDGYFPEAEIRTEETSAAVSHVAAVPFVRDWMKERQRSCVQFGNLVMEGRDIGSNIFPETSHKFYMDAAAAVRLRVRRGHARGRGGEDKFLFLQVAMRGILVKFYEMLTFNFVRAR